MRARLGDAAYGGTGAVNAVDYGPNYDYGGTQDWARQYWLDQNYVVLFQTAAASKWTVNQMAQYCGTDRASIEAVLASVGYALAWNLQIIPAGSAEPAVISPAPAPAPESQRILAIRSALTPYKDISGGPSPTYAVQIAQYIHENQVTYSELEQAMGWTQAQIDAIVQSALAQMQQTVAPASSSTAPAPAPAPATSSGSGGGGGQTYLNDMFTPTVMPPLDSSLVPGGGFGYDEGSFDGDNKVWWIAGAVIAAAVAMRAMRKGGGRRRVSRGR
jgi:pyruvate/2-oxoglutarate dehydrogenase complex dihydrolipoamide acyltransferase (E2) component